MKFPDDAACLLYDDPHNLWLLLVAFNLIGQVIDGDQDMLKTI